MGQFYLPPGAVRERGKARVFQLAGPEAFHITKVLRYREGQAVDLFDGRGGRYKGLITRLLKDGGVEGELTETLASPHEGPAARLRLYQGLLKSSHWDWVVEKGTELGVAAFVPVLTPRTVVLLHEAEKVDAKLERWRRVAMAAAKQCGRAGLPEILAPAHFRDAVAEARGGLSVLAWEKMAGAGARDSLKEALDKARAGAQGHLRVNLFVGPEGGFSEDEVELAESSGAVLFGLGSNTLRAETAAIAAVSILLYELGEL